MPSPAPLLTTDPPRLPADPPQATPDSTVGHVPRVTSGRHLSLVHQVAISPRLDPDPIRRPVPGQQCLDLSFDLPCGLATTPEAPADVRIPGPRRWAFGVEPGDRLPTSRDALPPPGAWAARLAQAVLEVCSAGRPVAQLLRWTSPDVFDDLQKRYLPRAMRAASRRRVAVSENVRSVHVCEPADGVAEVSVFISGGERPRALALRLEGWRGRWICTTLDWI